MYIEMIDGLGSLWTKFSAYFESVALNVVGGAVVAVCGWCYLLLKRHFESRRFRRVFGNDIDTFYLAYGRMVLQPCFQQDGRPMEWPFFKPGSDGVFRITSLISYAEAKSTKYAAEAFGKATRPAPVLVSDEEIRERLDISFCSFGGYNNFKTLQVLDNEGNNYFEFDFEGQTAIVSKSDRQKRFVADRRYDYGLIIKLAPPSFPKRTWIAVAGIGESGTSGAAWYISRRWREIAKRVKDRPFGLVVRVTIGLDESATVVDQA